LLGGFDRLLGLLLLAEPVLGGSGGLGLARRAGGLRRAVVRAGGGAVLRRRAVGVCARAVGARRARVQAAGARLFASAHVLGPAAEVAVKRVLLDGDRARADRVEQRAIV